MRMQTAGTPQAMRNLNEYLILDKIISGGPQSRADLSRHTGLSKPTVSSAITQLIERGLVRETGRAENTQGRKATLLEFNPTCFYIIGAELGGSRMRLALADMSSGIVLDQQLPLPEDSVTGSAFQDYLVQAVEGLLAAAGISWEKIRAAAFGIPGVVDPADGTVSDLVAPLRGCEAALSKAALAELFPVPVVTENDVNLAAMAEYSSSGAAGGQSLLYFSIGEGTGGGLIIHGEIYRGLGGGAGELANLTLSAGRLEEVLSADGLLRLAAQKAGEQAKSSAGPLISSPGITADQLLDEVRQGDRLAHTVIDAYCSLLAEAIVSICALMAPGTIILGGELGRHGDVLLPRLEAKLSGLQRKPKLAASGNGDRDVVLGAVQIAVQSAFNHLRDLREQ
ncbi:ROK family transcriptional regulator [Paenibacillus piscarius]|uniref:ROK family transcriptional regulator n=1 Tax=Paenibacillus piscarius TaxID=1089681 RepID=UPI001EE7C888|nr:ROK family transcriptional regulator [Paenibacillus piscarius]